MIKINLGCGEYYASDWLNVDKWGGERDGLTGFSDTLGRGPDLIADVCKVPLEDNSASVVYCGHILEHLSLPDVGYCLDEVRRLLRPDGVACFVGPDCDRVRTKPEWAHLVEGVDNGGHRWPGDEHKWRSTGPATLDIVKGVFPFAFELPVANVPLAWPVVDRSAGWQFAILSR